MDLLTTFIGLTKQTRGRRVAMRIDAKVTALL